MTKARYIVAMAGHGRRTAIFVMASTAKEAEAVAMTDPAFGTQYTRVQAKVA